VAERPPLSVLAALAVVLFGRASFLVLSAAHAPGPRVRAARSRMCFGTFLRRERPGV